MRELFVWYQVEPRQSAEAANRVHAMHAELALAWPGLQSRLLTRRGAGEGPATWMETYSLPSSRTGIDEDLQADIERRAAALAGFIAGSRHAEVFDAEG